MPKKNSFGSRDPREMKPKNRRRPEERRKEDRQTDARRGQTFDDRLRDGFKMMRESGDGF